MRASHTAKSNWSNDFLEKLVALLYIGRFFFRDNSTGRWSGIIGDLVNGEIDIAVAGMTMTSEREEVRMT